MVTAPGNIMVVNIIAKQKFLPFHFTLENAYAAIEEVNMDEDELKEYRKNTHSVAYHLQNQLEELMIQEIRVCVPGHFQRGGTPSAFDRILTTKLGVEAANAVIEGDFGKMIGVAGQKMIRVPLQEIAGNTKRVSLDDPVILAARKMGVFFGD